MPVDRCSHVILVATALQLPSFLGASSDERVAIDIAVDVVYLIRGTVEKNLLPIDRKVKRKNQIPEYHAPSPGGTMRTIQDRLMKNLLIQWDIEEENQTIHEVWLVKNLLTQWDSWGGKPKADKMRPVMIMRDLTWLVWWKPDLVDLVKNLPT